MQQLLITVTKTKSDNENRHTELTYSHISRKIYDQILIKK